MNRRSFFAALVNPPAPPAENAAPAAPAITTRTGSHGERVSLLGYGAMRFILISYRILS